MSYSAPLFDPKHFREVGWYCRKIWVLGMEESRRNELAFLLVVIKIEMYSLTLFAPRIALLDSPRTACLHLPRYHSTRYYLTSLPSHPLLCGQTGGLAGWEQKLSAHQHCGVGPGWSGRGLSTWSCDCNSEKTIQMSALWTYPSWKRMNCDASWDFRTIGIRKRMRNDCINAHPVSSNSESV